MVGTNFFTPKTSTLDIALTDKNGYAVFAKCTGTPPTTASIFLHGCILIQTDTSTGSKALYENVGSTAVPSWNAIGDIATAEIADSAVTLAKLAAGITPSHIAKYAGTITWSGGGASLDTTITGALATDIVSVTVRVKSTEAASLVSSIPSANHLIITLSAANTTNDAQLDYVIFRAVA